MAKEHGITWLASYPKSGNTWLRCLLGAYWRNGLLDINNNHVASSDGAAAVIQAVAPMPRDPLNIEGELLLRPAGLMNLRASHKSPFLLKTHFANLTHTNCPPNIPPQLTARAVYMVRDPRCVLPSFSKHFNFGLARSANAMADKHFVIGNTDTHCRQWVSSWSQHVASWSSETNFPVAVVKYEDLVADTAGEFRQILEFLGHEIDEDLLQRAVDATDITRLQQAEEEHGFAENDASRSDQFFNGSGTDWRTEITEKWDKRIEDDHGEVMRNLGYLDREPGELTAVS